jgi:hypothetical protein
VFLYPYFRAILRKLFLLAIACSTVTACVTPPPPATPQEQDEAAHAFMACLYHAARTIDDHISPADSIARGLLSAYAQENARYKETFERSMNLATRRMFEQKLVLHGEDLSLATEFVLDERREHKNQPPDRSKPKSHRLPIPEHDNNHDL